MPIKPKFDMGSLLRRVDRLPQLVIGQAVKTLAYVGEAAVNEARKLPHPPESLWKTTNDKGETVVKSPVPAHQPNYIDWTANLRSSIGYVVVVDGEIVVSSAFQAERGEKGNGEEGARRGREFAQGLASRVPEGKMALILVAGMHYAAYVSSKGYDVLNTAAITAEQMATRMLASLHLDKNIKIESI